jgi:late competence protein required for DNA uptake (superfamily II DNA/RNA helicase)
MNTNYPQNQCAVQTPEERFKYFAALAYEFGKDNNDDTKQAPYSNHWYFATTNYADLNKLTKTFLGENVGELSESTAIDYEKYLIDTDLNAKQISAIKAALEKPVTIIQGPPGTGKTKTIFNLIACINGLGRTVAMVSSNNLAVSDVETKIEKCNDINYCAAFLGDESKRDTFNDTHGYRFFNNREKLTYKYQNKEYEYFKEEIVKMYNGDEREFLGAWPIVTSTIQSLKTLFSDGEKSCFDYIIIDEASLITIDLGIIAMTTAKQLVIVGDDNQLPPIVKEDALKKVHERFIINDDDIYKQTTDKSFMKVCQTVFDIKPIYLRKHYRCHPGIIGFCKDYVYKKEEEDLDLEPVENNTQIATIKENCPIRLVYFEGNYCESIKMPDGNNSKVNRKQINIFLNEEWEGFVNSINKWKTVCIMSPFRGQLEELEEKIKNKNNSLKTKLIDGHGDVNLLTIQTIHKSQGSEYDVVYLMPVEDNTWEFPWSQQKRLVNVAVSRAKEELIVITSTHLMNENVQDKLVERKMIEKKYIPRKSNKQRDREWRQLQIERYRERYQKKRKTKKTNFEDDQLFIQKLTDYVYKHFKDYEDFKNGIYGFHKSKTKSIFDTAEPFHNDEKYNRPEDYDESDYLDRSSGYEKRCGEVLNDIINIKEYNGCVTIDKERKWSECECISQLFKDRKELAQLSKEELEYYNNGNRRFDFIVKINKAEKLVIEVDGAHHRNDEQHRIHDKIRDGICKKAGIEVLRLPTDGSNDKYEEYLIKEKIDGYFIEAMKKMKGS